MSDENEHNHVAGICAAYFSHNPVAVGQVAEVIKLISASWHDVTSDAKAAAPVAIEHQEPAVSIRKSVTPSALFCLECGKKYKSLKRHIRSHGFTPEAYRIKWQLPSSYPMVASEYSDRRSSLAIAGRLGHR